MADVKTTTIRLHEVTLNDNEVQFLTDLLQNHLGPNQESVANKTIREELWRTLKSTQL